MIEHGFDRGVLRFVQMYLKGACSASVYKHDVITADLLLGRLLFAIAARS